MEKEKEIVRDIVGQRERKSASDNAKKIERKSLREND